MKFSIYRFDPDKDSRPYMRDYELDDVRVRPGMMLLEALIELKAQDESLSFRRSCGEGVCGSDAMNINGRNGLACITPLAGLKTPIELRPLPGQPVIRDLIVDLSQFYAQYRAARPYLINADPEPEVERLQSPPERAGWTACTSASCAPAAPPAAHRSGGIPTSFSGRPHCCSRGASSPTAAIRPRTSGSTIWRDRSSCSAATPS